MSTEIAKRSTSDVGSPGGNFPPHVIDFLRALLTSCAKAAPTNEDRVYLIQLYGKHLLPFGREHVLAARDALLLNNPRNPFMPTVQDCVIACKRAEFYSSEKTAERDAADADLVKMYRNIYPSYDARHVDAEKRVAESRRITEANFERGLRAGDKP